MKKIALRLFITILFICSADLYAQRIGLDGSYVADFLSQTEGGKSKTNFLNGWNAELRYEQFVRDSSNLSVSFGIGWEFRGNRYGVEWYEPYTTCTRFMHYLYVPVDVNYYFPLDKKKKLKVFVFGGPRLNVGLLGDYGHHYYMATRDYKLRNPFGSSFAGDSTHRFDFSIGAGVGIEYYGAFMKVGYDFPVTNSASAYKPSDIYQHNLRVTLGYMLDLRIIAKKRNRHRMPGQRSGLRQMALPEEKAMPGMNQGGMMRR